MGSDCMYIVILVFMFVFELFMMAVVMVHSNQGSRLEPSDDYISAFMERINKMLRKSGLRISAGTYLISITCWAVLCGMLAFIVSQSALITVFILAASALVPGLLLGILSGHRSKSFEERYARSLKQLASSLNAGRSIIQSVEDVAACKYVNENLRKDYLAMSNSLRLGIPVTEAFKSFAMNAGSNDAADVALAIEVQDEIGGHEAETILEIAGNIQERILLRKEIKTIFSSTASMIKIMNVVVPACMLVFTLTNMSYIGIYFSSPMLIVVFFILIGLPVLGMYLTGRTMKNIQPKD